MSVSSCLAGAFLAVAVMLGALPRAFAQGEDLIVPGERIDPFTIGMSVRELSGRINLPYFSQAWPDGREQHNIKTHRLIAYARDGKVTQPNTGDEIFHTKEGIRVGVSLLAVRARLGKPTCQTEMTIHADPKMTNHSINTIYGKLNIVVDDGFVTTLGTGDAVQDCSD